jgi:hypothetical protein
MIENQRVLIKSHSDVFLVNTGTIIDNIDLRDKVGIVKQYDPTDLAIPENKIAWVPVYANEYFLWLLPDEFETI